MPEPLTDTARAALDHLDWTLATSSTNEEIDALLAWNLIEKIEGVHTEAHQFERTPLGCAIIAPDPVNAPPFSAPMGKGRKPTRCWPRSSGEGWTFDVTSGPMLATGLEVVLRAFSSQKRATGRYHSSSAWPSDL